MTQAERGSIRQSRTYSPNLARAPLVKQNSIAFPYSLQYGGQSVLLRFAEDSIILLSLGHLCCPFAPIETAHTCMTCGTKREHRQTAAVLACNSFRFSGHAAASRCSYSVWINAINPCPVTLCIPHLGHRVQYQSKAGPTHADHGCNLPTVWNAYGGCMTSLTQPSENRVGNFGL
jgi:hypothetical protein